VLCQKLFEAVHGIPVPRRSLIPVIAWLCEGNEGWNNEIRTRVVKGAPDIHLEYGDPERLPLDYKRKLLAAWIERNKEREDVWTEHSPDALRRLAQPELVPDCHTLSRQWGNLWEGPRAPRATRAAWQAGPVRTEAGLTSWAAPQNLMV